MNNDKWDLVKKFDASKKSDYWKLTHATFKELVDTSDAKDNQLKTHGNILKKLNELRDQAGSKNPSGLEEWSKNLSTQDFGSNENNQARDDLVFLSDKHKQCECNKQLLKSLSE